MDDSNAEVAPKDRLYFPELDGMRFFAFLMVFLFHQGVPSRTVSSWLGKTVARCFRENGWVGVQLFFILSGYLITTLLLREEAKFGRVDLKAFWVRRTLRIWPLYYLTVVVVFLLLPALDGTFATVEGRRMLAKHLPWFLTFLGNWSTALQGPVWTDAQSVLWSVCVEEQFYLVVPLIVAFAGGRWRIRLVALAIASSVGFRARLSYANANQTMIQWNTFAQADTLLSGVMLALLLGIEPRDSRVGLWLRWLRWPIYAGALWVFGQANLGHGEAWRRTWDFVAIWFLGVLIIATAVTVPGWLRSVLSHPRIVWLGTISYGLYMFHEVAFRIRDKISEILGWFPFQDEILPMVALGITIGMAWASYKWWESPFLKLKRRWTRVNSRPV